MNKIKFIINNFGIVFGVLALASLVAYADVWQPPTAVPPGNNTAAPINVSVNNQVKIGGLGVGPLAVFGDALVSGVYKQGGGAGINTGISLNCAAGQTIGAPIISGGIVTGGSCGAGGGGGSGGSALQISAQTSGNGKVTCTQGKIIGGGCSFQRSFSGTGTGASVNACNIAESYPNYSDNSWNCTWHTASGGPCGNSGETHTYAICE